MNSDPNYYAILNDDNLVVAIMECPQSWNYASDPKMIKLDTHDNELIDTYFYDKETRQFIDRKIYNPDYKTKDEIEREEELELLAQADKIVNKDSLEAKVDKLTELVANLVTKN